VRQAARVKVDDQLNITGTLEATTGGEFIPASRVIASTININNGGVITQLPTTNSAFFKLDLTANSLIVDTTGKINVTGRGFLGAGQPGNPFTTSGMTVDFVAGSTGSSGGSYGGVGAGSSPNPFYGNSTDPNEVGSGGGRQGNPAGGNGGGLVRLVSGTIQLDGIIAANGADGGPFAGGGSGGGIRIDVGTLQGTGTISANGGSANGGGGGRVAVYFQDITGFNVANITASGGPGAGNGTVFQQQFFAQWVPTEGEAPIMKAEVTDKPVRLATLGVVPLNLKPDTMRVKMADFKGLITKMQAQIAQVERPQRRMYRPAPVPIDEKQENLYLAMVSDMYDKEPDLDPIYVYGLNGNYDELNRLTSITNNEGLTTTFAYDALGRRTSMTHYNGVVTTYNYDAASQLLDLVHKHNFTTINSFNYAYDKVGNRKTKADNNGTANYTYDTLNRLINATNPFLSNPLESFTYDEVGNRTDSNQNGLSTFNAANQLEGDADFTYSYDNNGNQIQKTNNTTSAFTLYEYDAENKLIRVVREDGSIVNYKYDGLGRRIEKEVDSVVTQYIYDNEDILLELDGSNNIVARYTHGPGVDEPLIIEKGGQSFFYHADDLGSITELTDTAGSVAQAYTYSSFGKIESQLDPAFIQPYTFTAREFDSETALYYYRARHYDPLIGRFLQEDPLGVANETNFYSYASNGPINFVDPFGEASKRRLRDLTVNTPQGPLNLKSPTEAIRKALDQARSSGAASKDHITNLEALLKVRKKTAANVAKSLGRSVRRTGKKSVVGFIAFGLLDDVLLALEALQCGRTIQEQFRENVEAIGNPEFIPVGGVVILPNPYFVPRL